MLDCSHLKSSLPAPALDHVSELSPAVCPSLAARFDPSGVSSTSSGCGDHVTSSSTPRENGEATDEKGKSKISPISSSADKKHNALTAAALYQSWLRAPSDSEDDDDDDDEGDESFEGQDER
uniref:Uncharacterized protein n=1 Tax=Timema genevievae TaxID=629358 RepID=A0A7R9K5B4_TIMGE|nr:unnamed protein product [Timema genevievae]